MPCSSLFTDKLFSLTQIYDRLFYRLIRLLTRLREPRSVQRKIILHRHKLKCNTFLLWTAFIISYALYLLTDLPKEINVFDAVGLGSKVFPGVSSTAGQNNKSPAYHFTQKTDHMIASQNAFEEVDKLIHNSSDFIVSAYAKLGAKEIYKNPIVSINSKDGNQLYFLLQISWVLRLSLVKLFSCLLYAGELTLPLRNVSLIFTLIEKSILVFELMVLSGPELIFVYVALQQ